MEKRASLDVMELSVYTIQAMDHKNRLFNGRLESHFYTI